MMWVLVAGFLTISLFLFLIREDFKSLKKELILISDNHDNKIKNQFEYLLLSLNEQRGEMISSTRNICYDLKRISSEIESLNKVISDTDRGLPEIILHLKQIDTVQDFRLSNVESYLSDVLKTLNNERPEQGQTPRAQ